MASDDHSQERYLLITARSKLCTESTRKLRNLRRLVGHANFLDTLEHELVAARIAKGKRDRNAQLGCSLRDVPTEAEEISQPTVVSIRELDEDENKGDQREQRHAYTLLPTSFSPTMPTLERDSGSKSDSDSQTDMFIPTHGSATDADINNASLSVPETPSNTSLATRRPKLYRLHSFLDS